MAENILELRNITKTFGNLVAVDNVDFTLKEGEVHAILGENGAGKSTLMHLIYGLYHPTSGSIRVAGKPKIFKTPRDAIANGIGMVHQHFMLIENLTVAENIALSPSHLPEKHPKNVVIVNDDDGSTEKNVIAQTTVIERLANNRKEGFRFKKSRCRENDRSTL